MIAPLPQGDRRFFQHDTQHRHSAGTHIVACCGGNFGFARADTGQPSITVHRGYGWIFGAPGHCGRWVGLWLYRSMELDFTARRNLLCGRRNRHARRILGRYQYFTGGNDRGLIRLGNRYLDGDLLRICVGWSHIFGCYGGFQRIVCRRDRYLSIPVVPNAPLNFYILRQCVAVDGIG